MTGILAAAAVATSMLFSSSNGDSHAGSATGSAFLTIIPTVDYIGYIDLDCVMVVNTAGGHTAAQLAQFIYVHEIIRYHGLEVSGANWTAKGPAKLSCRAWGPESPYTIKINADGAWYHWDADDLKKGKLIRRSGE